MVSVRTSQLPGAVGAQAPGRPWEPSGQVDVERLAAWAYGVQMVDRFERTGLHPIEAAAAGYEVSSYSADGVGQLMQISHLGARIDRGGVTISDTVHPAAFALASELAWVDGGQRVRYHALAGTRPRAWVPPVHKVRPTVWVEPGRKAQVEYQGPGRKGGYCQVIICWDAQREAWGRSDYRQWWDVLVELAARLSRRALGFVVTGPAAPAEPWAEGGRPDGDRREDPAAGGWGLGSSQQAGG